MPLRSWPIPANQPGKTGPGSEVAPADAVASRLEAIRLRFLARLRDDYELLSRQHESGDLGAPDLAMVVHRMAGSAGLVGFPQISEAAHRLDDALAERTPEPGLLLEELLGVLRAVLLGREGEQPS